MTKMHRLGESALKEAWRSSGVMSSLELTLTWLARIRPYWARTSSEASWRRRSMFSIAVARGRLGSAERRVLSLTYLFRLCFTLVLHILYDVPFWLQGLSILACWRFWFYKKKQTNLKQKKKKQRHHVFSTLSPQCISHKRFFTVF